MQTVSGAGLSASGLTTGRAPFIEEARSRGELYIDQRYDLYSAENHEAWRLLYNRIQPKWQRFGNEHFLNGIRALDFPADRIPRFSEINARLAPLTGFQGERGQRLRSGVPLLRLPAPPRVPHHDHHPARDSWITCPSPTSSTTSPATSRCTPTARSPTRWCGSVTARTPPRRSRHR